MILSAVAVLIVAHVIVMGICAKAAMLCAVRFFTHLKEKNVGYKSCGECSKLPCDLILGTRDPKMSEEEFMKTVDERVKRLRG